MSGGKEGSGSLELLKVGEKRRYKAEGAKCRTAKIIIADRWQEMEMGKLVLASLGKTAGTGQLKWRDNLLARI